METCGRIRGSNHKRLCSEAKCKTRSRFAYALIQVLGAADKRYWLSLIKMNRLACWWVFLLRWLPF